MKQNRLRNLERGEEQLEELVAFDYSVTQFSMFHFRINGRLDVWPSSKKWFDRLLGSKGVYQDLIEFVKTYEPINR